MIFQNFENFDFFQKLKMIFLQDENIFFIRIFFNDQVCISATQGKFLARPWCLLGDATRPNPRQSICTLQNSTKTTLTWLASWGLAGDLLRNNGGQHYWTRTLRSDKKKLVRAPLKKKFRISILSIKPSIKHVSGSIGGGEVKQGFLISDRG